ncbi:MAG: DUF4126 domain-containing protein [Leptolyngbyaceae cyanobacterium]
MDIVESIGIGLGLGAAAGFRTLVPFWVLSAAALFGHLPLADNMTWLGTYPAFISLAIALLIEVLAYSIPWLDTALDAISLPIAAVAGTLLMALAVSQYDPLLQWSLAIIAGGGTAATTRGLSSLTRLFSTATTGGLTNFVVAIAELTGAVSLSVLALTTPLFVIAVVIVVISVLVVLVMRVRSLRRQSVGTSDSSSA